MRVGYIHTFTVTVEGGDSFSGEATMDRILKGGADDARLVQLFTKRGGGGVQAVRSSVVTKTIIVHEPETT